jgi:hypothetical protein
MTVIVQVAQVGAHREVRRVRDDGREHIGEGAVTVVVVELVGLPEVVAT